MFSEFEFTTSEALKQHLGADSRLSSKIDAVIVQLEQHGLSLQRQTPHFKAKLCLLLNTDSSVKDIADRLNCEAQSVALLKAGCPDVNSELIDLVSYELMLDQHYLYWERQDEEFRKTIFALLNEKPAQPAASIVKSLIKSINEGRGASNAQIFQRNGLNGYDVLGPHIGTNFIDEGCVQRLVGLIGRKSPAIEILAPIGLDSQATFLELARPYLDATNVQHIMFPFCNRREMHWYWVTISKSSDNQLNIEVFNPTCGNTASIYYFIDEAFKGTKIKYTKKPFENLNQLIQPQRDGWSCGYYTSAYAHLKIKQLDSTAECNEHMINALKRYGNRNYYLRDVCLHEVNPLQCPMPNMPSTLTSFFSEKQAPATVTPKEIKTSKPNTKPEVQITDFDSLFTRPITPETTWNLRGIQQASWLTILTEGLILTAYFNLSALSFMNPAILGAVMIVAAIIVISASNHYESLTM